MNPHAEGQVLVVAALDVERVGVGEPGGIAIGGVQHLESDLAFQQFLPAQLNIVFDDARLPGDGTLVAQHLLDRRSEKRGVLAQLPSLAGVREDRVQTVADQGGGCLVPRAQDGDARIDEFLLGEPVSFRFSGNQLADHIVGRIAPFLIH